MEDASRSSRLRTLLEGAWAREEPERTTWLREACADDPDLLTRVQALVTEDGLPDGFLESPIDEDTGFGSPAGDDFTAGARVGPWQLERELGRGGMGTVWLAARADEAFERRVAIKVLRTPLLDREMQLRFRRETVVQASLDHPGIARLIDSGVTEAGRPYLVLEFVDGRPIDRYCTESNATPRERLELFARVCDAVHDAHRMLIVHRDLKPGNVLVTGDGQPKLLDFGIAKLLEPTSDETWVDLTREEQRLFTPSYASPEQLLGEPVGVASDVYSLGVLLYELLVGSTPFQRNDLGWAELSRRVETDEVRPPSQAADNRRFAGDIDAIVLNALRREPERRYGSVEALADDVRRHLEGLPVRARPDTLSYRTSRFLRRNRVLAAATAAALVALVVGLISTLLQYGKAEDARELAVMRLDESTRLAADLEVERSAAVERANELARLSADLSMEVARSEEIRDFVLGIFQVADPNKTRGETVTARELLDAGVERLRNDLREQPETRADLLEAAGGIYSVLGLYDEAWTLLTEVRDLRAQENGDDSVEFADALDELAELARIRGDYDLGQQFAERTRALRERHGDRVGIARSTVRLARVLHLQGDFAQAEAYFEEGLDLYRETVGDESLEVVTTLAQLGNLVKDLDRSEEAEALFRRALEVLELLFPGGHIEQAGLHIGLAGSLRQQGEYAAALEHFEQALRLNDQFFGPQHPNNAFIHHNRAVLHQENSAWDLAEEDLRAGLDILHASFDEEHSSIGMSLASLGRVLAEQGRDEEALENLYRALDIVLAQIPDNFVLTEIYLQLGRCMLRRGDYAEGERMLLESLALCEDFWGNDDFRTQNVLRHLVDMYTSWGRPDEAGRYRERLS